MADHEERGDRFKEVETFEGYQVNDRDGDKIGKVDDLFVDEGNDPEYIGVKMGLLGMNSTLIPMELCSVDESDQVITVSAEKDRVQDGPSFDDDQEITPEFEDQVRSHYDLRSLGGSTERGQYGAYYSDEEDGRSGATVDDHDEDEDKVTVERTEEELRTATREREREEGGVNVRKRVRTDREQVRVPKKREEVTVERVDMDDEGSTDSETIERGEATEEDEEIRVPVKEEEVVTEKKPVVKEELRIKKDVVEDEEIIEEDVRKEEIEVDEGDQRDR